MKQARPYPRAIVTRKAARSLASGHPWVFEDEVLRLEPAQTDGRDARNGDVVDIFEENGTWQGAGLLSEQSKIRVRVVTRNANDRVDDAFWRRRAQWAWQHRRATMGTRALPGCPPDTNACRVVFSEADGFPGLVVDRYENVLVTQVGTVGMDRLRPVVYRAVLDALSADGEKIDAIFERNDSPARAKEGLPLVKGWWDGLPTPQTPRACSCARTGSPSILTSRTARRRASSSTRSTIAAPCASSPPDDACSTASATWGPSGSTRPREAPSSCAAWT